MKEYAKTFVFVESVFVESVYLTEFHAIATRRFANTLSVKRHRLFR